jgi:hypothetical protein
MRDFVWGYRNALCHGVLNQQLCTQGSVGARTGAAHLVISHSEEEAVVSVADTNTAAYGIKQRDQPQQRVPKTDPQFFSTGTRS